MAPRTSPDPSRSTAAHPAPQRGAVSSGALWFALFGAPAAWSVQLLVSYALSSHSCFPRRVPLTAPTLEALPAWELGVAVAALVVALAAGGVAIHAWRATRAEGEGSEHRLLETGEGRTRFMAFAGVLVSGLFALGVVLNLITPILLPACG